MATESEQTESAPTAPAEAPHEPVLGVTLYERVTSMLLALMITMGGVSAALGVMWASNNLTITREPPARVHLMSDDDLNDLYKGGGDPSGAPDGDLSVPGLPSDDPAVADDSDRPSTETPPLERTFTNVIDASIGASEMAEELFANVDFGLQRGRVGTNHQRIRGTGKGNDGGTRAAERWEIVFESGLTEDEYARQLDFLQIELGVVMDDNLIRISQIASRKPAVRVTDSRPARGEVVLIWRDERRRQVDLGFIRKSGEVTPAENAVVLHFLPSQTASKLLGLEREYAADHGRLDMKLVSKTRFVLRQTGAGYEIVIVKQNYLGSPTSDKT